MDGTFKVWLNDTTTIPDILTASGGTFNTGRRYSIAFSRDVTSAKAYVGKSDAGTGVWYQNTKVTEATVVPSNPNSWRIGLGLVTIYECRFYDSAHDDEYTKPVGDQVGRAGRLMCIETWL